jgi:hypothetical protein
MAKKNNIIKQDCEIINQIPAIITEGKHNIGE